MASPPSAPSSRSRRSNRLVQAAWIVAFLGTALAFLLGLSALAFSNAFGGSPVPVIILLACGLAFSLLWILARRIFRDTWPD